MHFHRAQQIVPPRPGSLEHGFDRQCGPIGEDELVHLLYRIGLAQHADDLRLLTGSYVEDGLQRRARVHSRPGPR